MEICVLVHHNKIIISIHEYRGDYCWPARPLVRTLVSPAGARTNYAEMSPFNFTFPACRLSAPESRPYDDGVAKAHWLAVGTTEEWNTPGTARRHKYARGGTSNSDVTEAQ